MIVPPIKVASGHVVNVWLGTYIAGAYGTPAYVVTSPQNPIKG